MNMFTTYIMLSSKTGKFYTGQTDDLNRRLEEHIRGKTPFMASGMPWKLVFSKEFNSRNEAIMLERFIKKRGAGRFLIDNNIAVV
jgi:putative endonuclease